MREVRPGSRLSQGRLKRREFYAEYIVSAQWYQRRVRWAEDETKIMGSTTILCRGCERAWALRAGDLHHVSYDRLGDEDHADLWALCRVCHTRLHEILESTKGWRKLERRHANALALRQVQHEQEREGDRRRSAAATIREFL